MVMVMVLQFYKTMQGGVPMGTGAGGEEAWFDLVARKLGSSSWECGGTESSLSGGDTSLLQDGGGEHLQ
eukprot:8541588-Ditylum_brightwellii.AAC.1